MLYEYFNSVFEICLESSGSGNPCVNPLTYVFSYANLERKLLKFISAAACHFIINLSDTGINYPPLPLITLIYIAGREADQAGCFINMTHCFIRLLRQTLAKCL